jgi:DTW domain-containing protein YfiP
MDPEAETKGGGKEEGKERLEKERFAQAVRAFNATGDQIRNRCAKCGGSCGVLDKYCIAC